MEWYCPWAGQEFGRLYLLCPRETSGSFAPSFPFCPTMAGAHQGLRGPALGRRNRRWAPTIELEQSFDRREKGGGTKAVWALILTLRTRTQLRASNVAFGSSVWAPSKLPAA